MPTRFINRCLYDFNARLLLHWTLSPRIGRRADDPLKDSGIMRAPAGGVLPTNENTTWAVLSPNRLYSPCSTIQGRSPTWSFLSGSPFQSLRSRGTSYLDVSTTSPSRRIHLDPRVCPSSGTSWMFLVICTCGRDSHRCLNSTVRQWSSLSGEPAA